LRSVSDHVDRQLLFEVGGYLFAAEPREVVEVLEPTEATPVPGAVPGVRGLINVRGTLLVSGELAPLLGLEPEPGEETVLVVFEHGGRRVALEVDRVVGMAAAGDLDVDAELLEALSARELVRGVGRLRDRPFFQLDMGAVFGRVLESDAEAGRDLSSV
jgi:purine-binding chemotaxis protein CheW